MHLWTQNLTEDEGKLRHWIWHNRGELKFGQDWRRGISWEWLLFRIRGLHFQIDWQEESGYGFAITLPFLFTLYLHFDLGLPRPRGAKSTWWWVIFEFQIAEEFIWLNIWKDALSTSRGDWHFSFDWKKFLFGDLKYSAEKLEDVDSWLEMPEGRYRVIGEIERAKWERKRFVRPVTRIIADVKYEPPVPIPGKGENSWDCGDDAIMGGGVEIKTTLAAGLEQKRQQFLATRERHGGRDWVPDEGWTVS